MINIEKYQNGKYDQIFLALVTISSEILESILECILEIDCKGSTIINSKLYKYKVQSKSNFLDLVVKINEKLYVNIEINTNASKNTKERNYLFGCNLYSNVVKKGINPLDYPKVKQINLNFNDKEKYIIKKYKVIDENSNEILTEKMEIININMDKLKEKYYNNKEGLTNKLPLIILTMTKEELEEKKEENEMIKQVWEILENMNDEGIVPDLGTTESENEWYYDDLKKQIRDDGIKEGLEKGLEKGIKKGKIKQQQLMINNMLKENMDISLISKISGLSIEQINDFR